MTPSASPATLQTMGSPAPKWSGLTTAQSLAVASQFGVSLAVGVGLGLVAGQWLDGQIHTGPLFTLIGVFAGLAAGITGIVALYRATLRSSEREWRSRR
jgi:F0F1-type ATP synthase assembly protein I